MNDSVAIAVILLLCVVDLVTNIVLVVVIIRKNGHSSGARSPDFWILEFDRAVARGVRPLHKSLNEVRRKVGLGPFIPVADGED